MKFKIGDKVRRINFDYGEIIVDEIYTVIGNIASIDSIRLKEGTTSYVCENFELVESFSELLSKAKEIRRLGDKIICPWKK